MRRIVILGMILVACFSIHDAALAFTTSECISHESREIDLPYRLSVAEATARCEAIAHRIDKASKQIIGKWRRKAPNGQTEAMDFSSGGTVRVHQYLFSTHQMRDVSWKWSFENPYGTLGQESLQIDDGTLSSVTFSGSVMTITSHPADIDVIDRWIRVRS